MRELKYNLTAKQTKAAYELSDEIYSLLHDAELSGRLLSELVNILCDGDDLDLTHPELLACTISEAAWRLNILVDYAARMRDGLRDLDAAARERASSNQRK